MGAVVCALVFVVLCLLCFCGVFFGADLNGFAVLAEVEDGCFWS